MDPCAVDTIIVRPYQSADRPSVREICTAAAFHGALPGRILRDRNLLADILTAYYTDLEPETAVVAATGTGVAGYVIGTVSTHRFLRRDAMLFATSIVPRFLAGRYRIGPELFPLLATGAFDALLGQHPSRIFDEYPAHFHIALDPAVRSRGLGRRLLTFWMERIYTRGIHAIHCSTQSSNQGACAFFQKMGFTPLWRNPSWFWSRIAGYPVTTLLYGRKI